MTACVLNNTCHGVVAQISQNQQLDIGICESLVQSCDNSIFMANFNKVSSKIHLKDVTNLIPLK